MDHHPCQPQVRNRSSTNLAGVRQTLGFQGLMAEAFGFGCSTRLEGVSWLGGNMDEENRQGKVLLVLNSKSVCLRFSGYMAGRSFPKDQLPASSALRKKGHFWTNQQTVHLGMLCELNKAAQHLLQSSPGKVRFKLGDAAFRRKALRPSPKPTSRFDIPNRALLEGNPSTIRTSLKPWAPFYVGKRSGPGSTC